MAETETGQERTEEPTARKKQQSREKGQVPQSRELNTMLMMLSAGAALIILGPGMGAGFAELLGEYLSVSREHVFDPVMMMKTFKQCVFDALFLLIPFFIVMLVSAVAGPIMIGGLNFSTKAMAFKAEKLNPVKGLKRVFAVRGLVELTKALAKFLVIGLVAVIYLYGQADNYFSLSGEPVNQGIIHTVSLLVWAFLVISAALVLIAGVDVPFQLWDHRKQLRMTMQEVKDENKDTEGNPEIRSRIKRTQQEMAQRRMMAEVPKADVVITNPEHYSVALKYDQAGNGAPVVVAKGVDMIAMQIRTIAREHEVTIMQAPPLARAIYHTTELDQEIPEGLYLAVAQVLAYVFKLKTATRGQKNKQHEMNDLPIPDDMQYDS
ncbi:MAG: flagellar biosynthesis protein FlhB [Thioalkalispiraceae bacterium]|jgi:flagellar biosynthetic protein FlhB